MTWHTRYSPPVSIDWEGRPDLPANTCLFQTVKLLDLTSPPTSTQHQSFALLGFCCDEGIQRNHGRPGAMGGPAEIRKMLGKLPVPRDNVTIFDAGDITCMDTNLEDSQTALRNAVNILLDLQITPILLGGGHEMAWGHYQGIAVACPDQLGIVNFDAHFDMRALADGDKGTSGTPFLQIAEAQKKLNRRFDYTCIGIQNTGNIKTLYNTAKENHVHVLSAEDIQQNEPNQMDVVKRALIENEKIYLSLCLDVIAAPFAPGVSAPQPFGLIPWSILPFIKALAQSGKVISYDIAELSPPFDIDHRTAKLAAHYIHYFMQHHHFKE